MTEATSLLVIGYGNDLRSDDGAGRVVAAAIEDLALPGVSVLSIPQLTPEVATAIESSERVVFVDADVEVQTATVQCVAASGAGSRVMTHHGSPESLLSLAESIGAKVPEALAISIPASNLSLGFTLSESTARGVEEAVALIELLARSPSYGEE